MGNEQWQMRFTGFCQMHLVSDPRRTPLLAVMSLFVIRRADVSRRWGNICRGPQSNHIINALIILYPHSSQHFDSRNLTKPLGSGRLKDSIKQCSSVLADFFGEGFPCGISERKT